ASSSAVDEGRRFVVALRGRTDAYRDHIKAAFVGAGLSPVPAECGEYSTTGNEFRTMVRRSDRLASGETSPTARAWMRRLPMAVAAARGAESALRPGSRAPATAVGLAAPRPPRGAAAAAVVGRGAAAGGAGGLRPPPAWAGGGRGPAPRPRYAAGRAPEPGHLF